MIIVIIQMLHLSYCKDAEILLWYTYEVLYFYEGKSKSSYSFPWTITKEKNTVTLHINVYGCIDVFVCLKNLNSTTLPTRQGPA